MPSPPEAPSLQCDDEELLYRVCIFHDMVYHQGWLLYLLEGQCWTQPFISSFCTSLSGRCMFSGNLAPHNFRVSADEKAASKTKFPNLTLWEVGNGPNWAFTIHERVRKVSLAEMQSRLAAEARDAQKPGTIRVAEFEKSILHKTRTMTHIFWGMNGEESPSLEPQLICRTHAVTWSPVEMIPLP